METKNYKIEDITAYLLGSLPAAEAEVFDELSFTDDDFNDQLTVFEKDLIDAYVQGGLTSATLEKFESYYLASPRRREKVEFAKTLQIYAKNEIAKTSEKGETEQEKIGFFTFISNLFGGNSMQFGFAAAALLFLILGGFWVFTSSTRQPEVAVEKTPEPNVSLPVNSGNDKQIPSVVNNNENVSPTPKPENVNTTPALKPTKPTVTPTVTRTPTPSASSTAARPIIATFLLTPPLRGSGQVPVVSFSKQTTGVSLQLQLESDDYAAYQVSLVNQAGKSLRQSGKLKAGRRGDGKVLSLSFPAQLLQNGFYTLSVSGIKADGTAEIISDYPFRAVLK